MFRFLGLAFVRVKSVVEEVEGVVEDKLRVGGFN